MRLIARVTCFASLGLSPVLMAQPAADLCSNAPVISAGSYLVEIDASDGHDGNFPSCSRKSGSTFFADRDVWYKYIPSFSGEVIFELPSCDQTDEEYSRGFSFSLWDACGGPQEGEISGTCERDGCYQIIRMQVTQNQTYLIRIAAYPQSLGGVIHEGYATLNITEIPPPANDNCENAQEVGLGPISFDNRSATYQGPLPSCSNVPEEATQRDAFFAFTSPATAMTYVLYGGADGAVLSVRDTTCTGTELACDPPTGFVGNLDMVSFPATAGHRYIIRAAADAGSSLNAVNSIGIYQPPSNETCETASPIVGPGTRIFSFLYAQTGSGEPYPSCGVAQDANQRDLWFQYTAQSNGTASITDRYAVFTPPTSGANITKSVLSGCGPGATQIACATKRLCFPIVTGQNYWLRCSSTNFFDYYAIDIAEYPVVAGDSCVTALVANTGTTLWSNTGVCDRDPLEDRILCGEPSIDMLWFAFTPNVSGTYSFSTLGTAANTGMQVYGSCDADAIPLACNDDITAIYETHRESYIPSISINAGSTVYVRISVLSQNNFVTGVLSITNDYVNLHAVAQVQRGNGPLSEINGELSYFTDAKIYKIRICDYLNFSAATGIQDSNTALCLFDADGYGVAFNDDTNQVTTEGVGAELTNQFIDENGDYYLAVSGGAGSGSGTGRFPTANGQLIWEVEPRRLERDPDGPGAANPFTGWTGIGDIAPNTPFTITLTGACPIEAVCAADFNTVNGVTVQDIFDFLTAWLAGNPSANFNGVNGVTVQDIFDFLTAWLAGC